LRALAARDVAGALLCRNPLAATATEVARHDDPAFPIFTSVDPASVAPTLAAACEATAIVVIDAPHRALARAIRTTGLKRFAWVTVPVVERPAELLDPDIRLLAASAGLAAAVAAWYGLSAEILPIPTPTLDIASTREHALFVDPRPAVGIETLFALAASRPDVRFTVVETEPVSDDWRTACFERARRCGNIDWRSDIGDLPSLLDRTRLLIAPSLAPDADPWAIRAAQAAGIPALAASQPLFIETLGDAGLAIAAAGPVDVWRDGFDRLWQDGPIYEAACRAAAHRSSQADAGATAATLMGVIGRAG
jgi:hypothetical protein